MKINTILAISFLASFSAHASNYFSEKDDYLHSGASMIIGSVAEAKMNNLTLSTASCMAVGLAKEIKDEVSYGGFSTSDLGYDALGCVTGVVMTRYLVKGLYIKPSNGGAMLGYKRSF